MDLLDKLAALTPSIAQLVAAVGMVAVLLGASGGASPTRGAAAMRGVIASASD
jgi:hypothetical protein